MSLYPGYYHRGESVTLLNDTLQKRKDGAVYVQVIYDESNDLSSKTVKLDEIIFSADPNKNDKIKNQLKKEATRPVPIRKPKTAKSFMLFPAIKLRLLAYNLN